MSQPLNLKLHHDKLHALRAELDAHVLQLTEDITDVADSGDRANQQAEAVVNVGLATHDAVLRREIDDALERINAGTFAACEKCQAVIGMRRLNAIPYARYCIRCERRLEQEGAL